MKTKKELNEDSIANKPEYHFISGKGKKIKLIFERVEYRAYQQLCGDWLDMKLGSSVPEPLIKYITERY